MVNPSLTNIECLTKKNELWIDLDFRYSILKKRLLDSDSKVECWIQFDILYSRFKNNNNVELSLIIDIRE